MDPLPQIIGTFSTLINDQTPSEPSDITDIYLRVQEGNLSIERPSLRERIFSKGSFRFSACAASLLDILSKTNVKGDLENVQPFLTWCTNQAEKYKHPWWAGIAKIFGITKAIAERERVVKQLQDAVQAVSKRLSPAQEPSPPPKKEAKPKARTPAPAAPVKKEEPKARTPAPKAQARAAAPMAREAAMQAFEESLQTLDDEVSNVVQKYLTPKCRSQLLTTGKVTVEERVKKGRRPKFKIKLVEDEGKIRIIAREYINEGGYAMLFRKSEWNGDHWNITAYRKATAADTKSQEEMERSLRISALVHKTKAPHVIQMDEVAKGTDASIGHGPSAPGTKATSMKVFYDGDLIQLINEGRLRPEQRQSVAMQMAQAVQEFHDANAYHLDIKPGNFLFKRRGDKIEVVLTDFGLSRASDEGPLTNFIGSAFFAAPEILDLMQKNMAKRTPVDLTPSIDMYSLGISLLELCTGQTGLLTGIGGTAGIRQAAKIKAAVEAFRTNLQKSDQAIGRLIARLLDPNPKERSNVTIDTVIGVLRGWDGTPLPKMRIISQ